LSRQNLLSRRASFRLTERALTGKVAAKDFNHEDRMNVQAPSQPTLFKLLRMPVVVAIVVTATAAGCGWMLGAVQPAPLVQASPRPTQTVGVQDADAASFAQAWEQVNRKAALGGDVAAGPAPGVGHITTTGLAPQDTEMMALYAQFDAQLKPVASLPVWAMNRNLHAEVSGADANATVSGIACAEEFCRFRVASAGGALREELLDKLGSSFAESGSAVMYRYLENNSQEAVVYLMTGVTPPVRTAHTQDAAR
jgi:hypothetical protein